MVVTLFSAVLLFCMITGNAVFYPVGGVVQTFMLGFTGYFGYPLLLFLLLSGIMAIIGKKIVRGKGVTKAVALTAFMFGVHDNSTCHRRRNRRFLCLHSELLPCG